MNRDLNRKPRVLIADDEQDLLLLLQKILAREGYAVETSLNAENLLEQVKLDPPDIVLLDIRMQGADGGEICRELKKDRQTSEVPVVLFSANHDIKKISSECGADDFLEKPLNPVAFREVFNRLMKIED